MRLDTILNLRCAVENSEAAWRRLHTEHEGTIVKGLKEQGRKVQMVQSAAPEGDYMETVVYSGFTTAPDLRTFVRTYKDGRLEHFSKGMGEK
jgi:hypothetical protein